MKNRQKKSKARARTTSSHTSANQECFSDILIYIKHLCCYGISAHRADIHIQLWDLVRVINWCIFWLWCQVFISPTFWCGKENKMHLNCIHLIWSKANWLTDKQWINGGVYVFSNTTHYKDLHFSTKLAQQDVSIRILIHCYNWLKYLLMGEKISKYHIISSIWFACSRSPCKATMEVCTSLKASQIRPSLT